MRSIVVFYSLGGNTRLVAGTLARRLESDMLEIKPVKEIKGRGLMKYVRGGRQAMMGNKPRLRKFNEDLDSYDLIIIGTPVWAGRPAPPVRSFMEDHLPQGKQLAFFLTHEGGEGITFNKMEDMDNGGKVISKKMFLSPEKTGKENTIGEVLAWASDLAQHLG